MRRRQPRAHLERRRSGQFEAGAAGRTWRRRSRQLGPGGDRGVLTAGQRIGLSNQARVFSENQFIHGERQSGLSQIYGLSYTPADAWTLSATVQRSDLADRSAGPIDRDAFTIGAVYRHDRGHASMRGEYWHDQGLLDRKQMLTANRADLGVTPSFTLLGKLMSSYTVAEGASIDEARFWETGLGLAYRPVHHQCFNLLAKHSFL